MVSRAVPMGFLVFFVIGLGIVQITVGFLGYTSNTRSVYAGANPPTKPFRNITIFMFVNAFWSVITGTFFFMAVLGASLYDFAAAALFSSWSGLTAGAWGAAAGIYTRIRAHNPCTSPVTAVDCRGRKIIEATAWAELGVFAVIFLITLSWLISSRRSVSTLKA